MISLMVDECYAFDYLSILSIKASMDNCNPTKLMAFSKCYSNIRDQIGSDLMEKIMGSQEYRDCLDANVETFLAVDKAKKDEVKASFVDGCNYKRYLAKVVLQKTFFDSNVEEVKVGYGQT